MQIAMFRPSKKGLKYFKQDDRISFIDSCYLWFKADNDEKFYFDVGDYPRGDVFEYKGTRMSKPDSYWKFDKNIESMDIAGYNKISIENIEEHYDTLGMLCANVHFRLMYPNTQHELVV